MGDPNGWGLDVVFYIFAEVDMTFVGDNEFLIQRGSHKVFPNPAKNEAHLIYSLVDDASSVNVAIYNVNGQQVVNYNRGAETAGWATTTGWATGSAPSSMLSPASPM